MPQIPTAVRAVVPPVESYIHNQIVASAVWTINHPLDNEPVCSAYDTAGTKLNGDEEVVSPGVFRITFSAATSGVAILFIPK